MIAVVELDPCSIGDMPFDEVAGFSRDWWNGSHGISSQRNFSVQLGEEEVARAIVDVELAEDLEGHIGDFVVEGRIAHISFFEVKLGMRGSGAGRAAVCALVESLQMDSYACPIPESVGFWASLGWREEIEDRTKYYVREA